MNPLEISANEFRLLADRITELAANYLDNIDSLRVSPATTGAESLRIFRAELPEEGMRGEALNLLPEVMRHSRVQNGGFFGYVLGSGEPVAATADLLASVLNPNATAWRSGPAAAVIEQTVIHWLSHAIGCAGFHGHLTGGGSSANLMALAMAREAKAAANERGVTGKLAVYASSQVHMSIPKSVAVLGIGRDNLRLIPADDSFRMIPAELEARILQDKQSGRIPLAVVASAGTVNTGAIDPLRKIAEIAQRHGLWFHVDGAYGALAAMVDQSQFDGLELADSISLDPHKWLYQPLDCGCLLYRSPDAARTAFSHTGDYARSLNADPVEGFAFFEESLELSRRFRALKLWLSLRYHGFAAFRRSIANDLAHARRLADAISREPQLEMMAPVELSAVCFRHRGDASLNEEARNSFNALLLKRVVERGRIYLSNASLRGKFCLRACVVNHRTTDTHIDSVVPEVLAAAKEALAGLEPRDPAPPPISS
jgi:glutamate/tyrosine decarboxylase-like PLP-dependent enzyme